MKRKIFIGIILVCLVAPLMFFGVYQVGFNSGYLSGKSDGAKGLGDTIANSAQKNYLSGYTDGLRDARATPSPSP